MKYYILLDEERIKATSMDSRFDVEGTEFDFPEDFDFAHQGDWKIIDEELVYDPILEIEPEPDRVEQLEAQVSEIRNENQILARESTEAMLAITEIYEMMLGGM